MSCCINASPAGAEPSRLLSVPECVSGYAVRSGQRFESRGCKLNHDVESATWPLKTRMYGAIVSETKASETVSSGAGALETRHDPKQGLVYARGFLLLPTGSAAPISVSHWPVLPIMEYSLHFDPRVHVEHASSAERDVWLVGDAFDPEREGTDHVASVLAHGNLLDHLDRLAGRFLLIVRDQRGRTELYHDAMGSRSVFHGPGVVASHSSLASEYLGTGLRDWVIPFLTSRGYIRRDVKFLPGLDSPFEDVEQLTPNTRLVLPSRKVERYWPREPIPICTDADAVGALVDHMRSLRAFIDSSGIHPVLGVSAGRDSRCLLAALSPLSPQLFTYVRGAAGSAMSTPDSRIARQLADAAGLELEVIEIEVPPHLDRASSDFARHFRVNTGHIRGNTSGWIEHLWDTRPERDPQVFIRGFGGEVMRGFHRLANTSTKALANTYDVNAGSKYTRRAFEHFREVTDFDESRLFGCSPSDLFYWEHRMGIWGSSSFTEADMALRSMPAYNSRSLFTRFWGLDEVSRKDGRHFREAAALLSPPLANIPYSS